MRVSHQMLCGRCGSSLIHVGFDDRRKADRHFSAPSAHEPPRATSGKRFSVGSVTGPSAGLQAGFYAKDTAGNPVGAFNNITPSDSAGTVNAQFWILDPNYTGFISLTAYVVMAPGDTIRGQNRMLITK